MPGGTAKCWGENTFGQLGDGATTGRSTPVDVVGLVGATALTSGVRHTCALMPGGTAKCWGDNAEGQLGDGTITGGRTAPVDVVGLVGATTLTAGSRHTCALMPGGTAKCWGENRNHELGANSNIIHSSTPLDVVNLVGATTLTAGGGHTCALMPGGTATCWGYNFSGQLGDGTTKSRGTKGRVVGLVGATELALRGNNTCALMPGGTVKCWGLNYYGQLGDGTTKDRWTPVDVIGMGGYIPGPGPGPDEMVDSDGDGLPDEWEIHGHNGVDLRAMGADPYRKDVFVHADWMKRDADGGFLGFGAKPAINYQPSAQAMERAMNSFDRAPVGGGDEKAPDGTPIKPGINLHIDAGPDSIMNFKTREKWGALSKAKSVEFKDVLGPYAEDVFPEAFSQLSKMPAERQKMFHAALFAHRIQGCEKNKGPSCSKPHGSGRAFERNFIVARGSNKDEKDMSADQETGTFLHELGHTLGIWHGGQDHFRHKPNYVSVMNYSFQFGGLEGAPHKWDYSRWQFQTLDKGRLHEPDGLYVERSLGARPPAELKSAHFCDGDEKPRPVTVGPSINWNCENGIESGWVQANINGWTADYGHHDEHVLRSYTDWDRLRFMNDAAGVGGAGAELPTGDELDMVTAAEKGILGGRGSSVATVRTPGTLVAGIPGQKIVVDVTNPSNDEQLIPVTVIWAGGETSTASVLVPGVGDGAAGTGQVEIEAPVRSTAGTETVTVTTETEFGTTREAELAVIALADDELDELRAALQDGQGDLEPAIRDSLVDAIDKHTSNQPQDPDEPTTDAPMGSLGTILGSLGSGG
jgi:hypothetical protein